MTKSSLITFDIEEFYPKGERVFFDISDWLEQGLVLKEQKFRDKAKNHHWDEFKGKYVQGTWRRTDISESFEFFDINQNPIEVPPSSQWIHVVPNEGQIVWSNS